MKYQIEPFVLASNIGSHWRNRNIVWLDMQIDKEKKHTFRFDIDFAFNTISIRRGSINRRDYYIGCTGAELEIDFNNSKLLDYTKAATLDVKYTNTKTIKRNSKLVFEPKIKSNVKATFDKSTTYTFTSSFQCEER